MRESPIYQEIIQAGVQRGKQAQIQNLSISQLDALSEALLDFSDATDLSGRLRPLRARSPKTMLPGWGL